MIMIDPDPYANGSLKSKGPGTTLIRKSDVIDRDDSDQRNDAEDANCDADDTEGKMTMSHSTGDEVPTVFLFRENPSRSRHGREQVQRQGSVGDGGDTVGGKPANSSHLTHQSPELELKDAGLTDQVSMVAVHRDARIAECAGAATENKGVVTMKQGEVRKFTHSPEFTCGMEGSRPKIDTNANPTIEMEMLN